MSHSQYFDEDPPGASDPVDVDVVLPDVSFRLTTDRGVFSRGALDTGTRLLLARCRPLPATGDLLDLGCGSGAIAVTMGLRAPGCTVWAVDVNRRALELADTNARRAGLHNVRVCRPDEVPGEVRFAAIWSNPPIRIGKPALHSLLSGWLGRLARPDGEALLVVQRHLGADSLAAWLDGHDWTVTRLAARAGYRLLLVAHPQGQSSHT